MRKMLMTLTLLVTVVAIANPTKGPDKKAIDTCAKLQAKALECKRPFIEAMVDLRAKHQAEIAQAVSTPSGRAEVIEAGMKELEHDGGGSADARRARCASQLTKLPSAQSLEQSRQQTEACLAKTDCSDRVACLMPIFEAVMFSE